MATNTTSATAADAAIQRQNGGSTARSGRTFTPSVDVTETPEAFILAADVPGATPESIDVTCHEGQLVIEARVPPRYPDGSSPLRVEYGVGGYRRVFRVGEDVDPERISATCADGVLTVHLPKSPESRPRRVEVRAG